MSVQEYSHQPSQTICLIGYQGRGIRTFIVERNSRMYSINARRNGRFVNDDLEMQEIGDLIQVINGLIETFDFEHANKGYLMKNKDGSYRLQHRYKRLRKVKTPTWTTFATYARLRLIRSAFMWSTPGGLELIVVNELVGKEFINVNRLFILSKDVFIAVDNREIDRLDSLMRLNLLLADLDLTYKLLAHLVDDYGDVIGFIIEERVGRCFQYRDRTLVYEAITRLQQHHLCLNYIMWSSVHVHNGKIRLADLNAIREIPAHRFDEMTCVYHWEQLPRRFSELEYLMQFKLAPNFYSPWPKDIPNQAYVLSITPLTGTTPSGAPHSRNSY